MNNNGSVLKPVNALRRLWSSPGGMAEVLRLALPMIISSGSLAIMQFADRVFLTWFDPEAMGASFAAGQFFWLLAAFPFSIATYTNAFVSQYNGAKEYRRIGPMVWQGVWIGILIAPTVYLLTPFYDPLFRFFGHSPEMAAMESEYLFWLLAGFAPMIANEALSAFFSGRKKMKAVMAVNLFAVVLNIFLDYGMIFGAWGFPRLGLSGAAIATTLSQWVRLAVFLMLTIAAARRAKGKYEMRRFGLFPKELARLLKFGGMGGVQFVGEMTVYALFILLLGMTGDRSVTASAIAFNLNALTFLPVVGTGVAVTTLVGNYLGAERPHLARRSAITALLLGGTFTGIFMILYLGFPRLLLGAYLGGGESFTPYYHLTVTLLRFVAVYLFFDTLNIIFCSALKGAGDTRFVMLTTLALLPWLLILPWAGIHFYGLGVYWCWTVLTAVICVMGLIFAGRFFAGRWLTMRLAGDALALVKNNKSLSYRSGNKT